MTIPLVNALEQIHDKGFGIAAGKIEKHQIRYAKNYDKKHKTAFFKIRKGTRVQVKQHVYKAGKFPKSKMRVLWKPFRSYYQVHAIDRKKGIITVRSKNGRVFKKQHPFARIRIYKGKA